MSTAPALVHTPEEQWLMLRRERVTATDAADLVCHALGDESGYRAPAEILAEKWGVAQEVKVNESMRWGHRLQRLIGEVYAEQTGRFVEHVPEFTLWEHPSIPWLASSGDATVMRDHPSLAATQTGPLEIKTDGSNWEADASPLRHQTQNQIQQACLGKQFGTLVAFVDRFRPLREEDIEFNQKFFDSIVPLLEEFYHYLKTRTMPKDPAWYTKAATKAFWGVSNGVTVALEKEDLSIVNEWENAKNAIKLYDLVKDRCEVALAVRIGDNYAGALPDGSQYRITRSPIEAQLCDHGGVIKNAHIRIQPRRWWPKHLKQAMKALSSKKEASQ